VFDKWQKMEYNRYTELKTGDFSPFLHFYSLINLIKSALATNCGAEKTKMEKKYICPRCSKRHKDDIQAEEFNLAVLIALVPLLVFTLFGQWGLF